MATYRKKGSSWEAQVAKRGVRRSKCFDTKAQATSWAVALEGEIEAAFQFRKTTYAEHARNIDLLSKADIIDASVSIPTAAGVYCLIRGGVVSYVGQSKNMLTRVSTHAASGRQFDRVTFIPCTEDNLTELERKYIQYLNPIENAS